MLRQRQNKISIGRIHPCLFAMNKINKGLHQNGLSDHYSLCESTVINIDEGRKYVKINQLWKGMGGGEAVIRTPNLTLS
jgi:hypothetical protein